MTEPSPTEVFGIFHLYIKPDRIDEFKAAVETVLPQSASEEGVVRFEYLQDTADLGHFTFVDIYSNAEAYEKHLASDHLRAFGEAIAPLVDRPHRGAFYTRHRIHQRDGAAT